MALAPTTCAAIVVAFAAGCGTPRSGPVDTSAGPADSADPVVPVPKGPDITDKQRESFAPALRVVGETKLYVESFNTLLLFREERREAQQLIADWAKKLGFHVLPPETVERTLSLAGEGKTPDGKPCGPPLDRALAVARWLPALEAKGHLKAAVYCNPNCTLQLEVKLHRRGTEFFAAPFDPSKPWREELTRSLHLLADNGGHGKHGHLNNPVAIEGVKRGATDRDWVVDESDVAESSRAQSRASACGADRIHVSVLLGKTGDQPLKCERFDESNLTTELSPAVHECLCKTLLTEALDDGRRRVVRINPPRIIGNRRSTKNGKKLWAFVSEEGIFSSKPWTERWFYPGCGGGVDCGDVGHCFADRTEAKPDQNINATIDFDGDGKATKVMFADFSGNLSKSERACLTDKLMTARAPCPGQDRTSRTGRLMIRVTDE